MAEVERAGALACGLVAVHAGAPVTAACLLAAGEVGEGEQPCWVDATRTTYPVRSVRGEPECVRKAR